MIKIDKENLPGHIAIVPDGNRRWARKKGLAPWRGHLAGAKRAEEQARVAFELGLKCVSWWGGSWENLTKRSKIEVSGLFRIYERYFKKLAKSKDVHNNRIKVNVIGRWDEILPKSGVKAAKEAMEITKNYNERMFNLFIAYNGTHEMLAAIKNIAKESKRKKNLKITEEILKKHLWSGFLPPVDLLIRTGSRGDPHNSVGFMMWNTANSQYYFSKEFYPDFGKEELLRAIKEYQRRERRMGK